MRRQIVPNGNAARKIRESKIVLLTRKKVVIIVWIEITSRVKTGSWYVVLVIVNVKQVRSLCIQKYQVTNFTPVF